MSRPAGKPAARATASSPPEQTSSDNPSSASQRTTARQRNDLPGVVDVAAVERAAPGSAAHAEVVLVEDVGGRTELAGKVVHPDAAHGKAPVVHARRERPDGGVEAGAHIRSGVDTPSRPKPFASTIRVAWQSNRRA